MGIAKGRQRLAPESNIGDIYRPAQEMFDELYDNIQYGHKTKIDAATLKSAAFTTGIEVIPAPPDGYYISLMDIWIENVFDTAQFNNIGEVTAEHVGANSADLLGKLQGANMERAADSINYFRLERNNTGGKHFHMNGANGYLNQAIVIKNSAGAATNGDGYWVVRSVFVLRKFNDVD